jgi:hypothetical protein
MFFDESVLVIKYLDLILSSKYNEGTIDGWEFKWTISIDSIFKSVIKSIDFSRYLLSEKSNVILSVEDSIWKWVSNW